MNTRVQRLLLWCAPVGFALLLLGFISASWIPFPSPNDSAAEVADHYRDNTDGVRLATIFITLGAALLAPLAAVIAAHIKRIEGSFSPITYLELGMGAASSLAVSVSCFFWWTAAFEPGRDPAITESWHDAGWLCVVAVVFIAFMQFCAVGLAAFSDESDDPTFPRWAGYLSFWAALLLVPSVLCLFFKTGAFAYSGVLTLYLAFAAAGAWFITMFVLCLRRVGDYSAQAAVSKP